MHRGRRPPVLPEAARQASIRGIVIVEITIGIDGGITDAHVVRSIPLLDAAALQCARQWRYQPVSMIERPPRRLERAAAAARPRAGNPRSGAPFDRPNNTRRQQRHFNGLRTYALKMKIMMLTARVVPTASGAPSAVAPRRGSDRCTMHLNASALWRPPGLGPD
ncbi:MAG: hypothetical protein DMG00_05205 [Acidobacteria bacterium]|nr:MAG: hypothetical protein DMG00_05205 [Acidobacteriota bacterium]